MILKGKTWRFGDNIDTDAIIPARYLNTSDPEELAKHVMEDADAEFPNKVNNGDLIVADANFGCGSSREHAPQSLVRFGMAGIVAEYATAPLVFEDDDNMVWLLEIDGKEIPSMRWRR